MTTASLLNDLVKSALKSGADAADVMLVHSASLSVGYRLGKLESLERSESGDLGLRVFIGKKQAMVSATDRRPETQKELITRAVAMAKVATEDIYCGLADPAQIAKTWPKLDMADEARPSA